ncbi:MAG: MarR family transcriptional regulator [Saprospiraceae bacterium]|nr:MarR family transcriptional regulator [Saprospiraceae bacterium]
MTIEEAIKQKKRFDNEFVRAQVNLVYTASRLNHALLRDLKKFGITTQQYNILRILKGRHPEPMTVKDLAARMIDKTSNASRLVDRLVNKNYVIRELCESDRRRVDVVITEKGIEFVKNISTTLDKHIDERFKNMTLEEAELLNSLLDKLK